MSVRYSDASAISGVPATTMRSQCDQGLTPLFTKHTTGKSRRFSVRDLLGLAVMNEIAAHGPSLFDAAKITKAALADLDEYCVSTGRDDPADIKTVGLDKAVLYFWREDGEWKSRLQHDYGWGEAFATAGIGQSDLPHSYAVIQIHIHMIAKDIAERIRAFEAAKKKKGAK